MPAASCVPASNFPGYGLDHLAAGKEGRHRVEQFVFAPQHAHAEGAKELVRRERQEVAADFGYVDLHVRHRLGTVDHEVAALLMHAATEFLDGVFDAQNIGHVHARENLRLRADFRIHFFGRDNAVLVGVEVHELRARRATGLLPRDEVRVVLHDGDAHFIARLENRRSERFGDDVERLARVAAHYDILGLGSADEPRNAVACHIDCFGCFDG